MSLPPPKGADAADVVKNAGIIGDEVARITKIIRQVLDFSRPRGPTVTRVHLGAVVAEALEFLRETIRRQGIEVDVQTMPAPPEVPGDPDQIQQVCLNLLMNAIHAMPNGGTLAGRGRAGRAPQGGPRSGAARPSTRCWSSPTAAPASRRPTARRSSSRSSPPRTRGRGPGLGLAVSHGIVKDHDGWIEVDSPAAGGAVFRVFLPCAVAATPGVVARTPTLPK